MSNKLAQAGGAAGLVAIIALLIVVYLLFIPPGAREELLNTTDAGAKASTEPEKSLLIFEHPGTLDPVTYRDREKVLDSFNLYTEKSAIVIKSAKSALIENGWLRKKTYEFAFDVKDLENTENYVLAFDVLKSLGRVIISLNEKEIYNAEVLPGNAEPINIDKSDIKSQNKLLFSVSDVGLAFWRLNEYGLKDVRVIADFTDVSKKEYKNSFVITATEKENFEATKLMFIPYCLTANKGPLKIKINDRDLYYSAVPDCSMLSKIEFDPNILKQGENTITFRAEEGNYLIDRVSIKADLKKMTYPFYYFELKKDDFKKVDEGKANVTLVLEFADKEDKLGEINVNGHLSALDTSKISYEKNINAFAEEGQNYIQIVPKTILNIVDLNVTLVK